MTDIVERLKQFGDKWPYNVAADEIETLRQRVKGLEELAKSRTITQLYTEALTELAAMRKGETE